MVFISTQLQNKSEEARLRKIFEKLDLNGDGQLSKEELLHGFKEIFPNDKQAEKEVDRILSEVDMNHNGFIDYSGICQYILLLSNNILFRIYYGKYEG